MALTAGIMGGADGLRPLLLRGDIIMSCKSALFTANTNPQTVAVGSTLALGSMVRRYGGNLNLNGNSIVINGCNDAGYYDVKASITAAPTAAGTVTVALLRNGVPVPGATASAAVSTAGNPVNLSIVALVREFCCGDDSALTLVLTGAAATVSNVAVVAERV